ncbi:MAG: BTB/POZ protein [Monoraphidium minutum]|nr:MAG: BTB/POZ protein [Monoraphidium minutum]
MWGLLLSEDFSDVCLVSGGRELPAHRAVLAAASPVFGAMLRAGMSEARTGMVRLPDADPVALELLLGH